jgi:hypothetical protein
MDLVYEIQRLNQVSQVSIHFLKIN